MSRSADVVVIGGGVIGLTVARRLALDGAAVELLERDECGRGASWAGAGIIAPCNPHRSDPIFHLHQRSLAAYPGLCAELLDETGIDSEYDACGAVELLFTEQSVHLARSDAQAAGSRTTGDGESILQLLAADQVPRFAPMATRELLGALVCRQTAVVRNPRLLAALRESCLRLGMRIRERTQVTGLVTSGTTVTGVAASEGMIAAKTVVLCAGAWSSSVDPRLAAIMPVHPVRGQMILLKLEQRAFSRVITKGKTYLVPRRDGHVLIGSTEEPDAGFRARCTSDGVAKLTSTAVHLVPSLADAPVVGAWAGLRPGTLDDKPFLGRVPGYDGLIAATGHFRAGLTLAQVTADVVAVLCADREYDLDLSCCAPGRSFRER